MVAHRPVATRAVHAGARRSAAAWRAHNLHPALLVPHELAGVYQLRQAKLWQGKDRAADTQPLIPHGSPRFQLVDGLDPGPGEAAIDQITISAFEATPGARQY